MNPLEPKPDESGDVDADPSESIRKSARNHWFLWGGLLFGSVLGLLWRVLTLKPLENSALNYILVPWLIATAFGGVVAAWGWSGVAGKTQSRILWTILMMHLTIPVSLIAACAFLCCK